MTNEEITPFSISEFTSDFFDSASKAWKQNKIMKGKPGSSKVKLGWRYGCEYIRLNGAFCKRKLTHKNSMWCSYHYKKKKYSGMEV